MIEKDTLHAAASALGNYHKGQLKSTMKDDTDVKHLSEQDWTVADIGELSSLIVSKFIKERRQFADVARNAIAQDDDVSSETLTEEELEDLVDARCEYIASDVAFRLICSFVDLIDKGRSEDLLLAPHISSLNPD